MIFYFTGTGNSLWVAKRLGEVFDESPVSIAGQLQNLESSGGKLPFTLNPDEKMFFVFPVHSWGVPKLVMQFIKHMQWKGYNSQPVYMVCTCGDECGYTDRILRKRLARKGITLTGAYSIVMPNNYILMKGFNTDSKEVEQQKLAAAPGRLQAIVEAINNHIAAGSCNMTGNVADAMAESSAKKATALYAVGTHPVLKSCIVYWLFVTFALKQNKFEVTKVCISCGLCEKICPTKTIVMEEGHPEWERGSCVQCTACIHRCPVRAIEYGVETWKKGRYHHPDLK